MVADQSVPGCSSKTLSETAPFCLTTGVTFREQRVWAGLICLCLHRRQTRLVGRLTRKEVVHIP